MTIRKTVKVRIRKKLHDELKTMLPEDSDAERMDYLWSTSTLRVTKMVENVLYAKKNKKK